MKQRPLWGVIALSLVSVICLTGAIGCGGSSNTTPVFPVQESSLRETVATTRKATGIPAIYSAVVSSDGITTAADGVRKQGMTDTVDKSDLVHLGSNTKAFTSTLAAISVEKGEIRWDSTIAEVFPELVAKMQPEYRTVTLEMLLELRGGLKAYFDAVEMRTIPHYSGSLTEQRHSFAEYILQQVPDSVPGEFNYSNSCYVVAAAMLEKATGKSWETLAQDRLYSPLGMSKVGTGWPAARGAKQPWGHVTNDDGTLTPHNPDDPNDQLPSYFAPAGDLYMSIGDYAKYVQMNLRGLRGEKTLIRPETMKKLHTPVSGGTYALGWGTQTVDNETVSFYVGSLDTFLADVQISPSRNRAVIAVTNVGVSSADTAEVLLHTLLITRK